MFLDKASMRWVYAAAAILAAILCTGGVCLGYLIS